MKRLTLAVLCVALLGGCNPAFVALCCLPLPLPSGSETQPREPVTKAKEQHDSSP